MFNHLFIVVIATTTIIRCGADNPCKGCVDLDELNFDKVIDKFEIAIVKFDIAYPYGDRHQVYSQLALDFAPNEDILVASVGVKDYGERDNEKLAAKYNIGKEDLPTVCLFGKKVPKLPPKITKDSSNQNWTVEFLTNFIRENSDFMLTLPGCLKEFDELAVEFMKSENLDREKFHEKAEVLLQQLDDKAVEIGLIYVKLLKKIQQVGDNFVQNEESRLKKIVAEGKIGDVKRLELLNRINILKSFHIRNNKPKDEL